MLNRFNRLLSDLKREELTNASDIPSKKTIIIIDDNLVIRHILGTLLTYIAQKFSLNLEVFTSSDGLEGMGYLMVTLPDKVVIDAALPKYSGREIIDFLATNERYIKNLDVIVLGEDSEIAGLPGNFKVFDKQSNGFVKSLISELVGLDETKLFKKLGLRTRLAVEFAEKAVMQSYIADENLKSGASSKNLFKGLLKLTKWLYYEALESFPLLLFTSLMGRWKNTNVDKKTKDYWSLRIRYSPAIVTSALVSVFILFQVFLLAFGSITLFNYKVRSVIATEETVAYVVFNNSSYDTNKIDYLDGKYSVTLDAVSSGAEIPVTATDALDYPFIVFNLPIEYSHIGSVIERSSNNNEVTSVLEPIVGYTKSNIPDGTITYQLSPNKVDWYFYDGNNWRATDSQWQTSNSIQELNAHISELSFDTGWLFFKVFLNTTEKPISLSEIYVTRQTDVITAVYTPEVTQSIEKEPQPVIVSPLVENYSIAEVFLLNAATNANGVKIVTGRVELPSGLGFTQEEVQKAMVLITYRSEINSQPVLFAITPFELVTINGVTQYLFEIRKPYESGGYLEAQLIDISNSPIDIDQLTTLEQVTSSLEIGMYATSGVLENSTFTVSDSTDSTDVSTGDGICDWDSVTLGSQCSLRAAIQEANALAGGDNIYFNIPDTDAGYKTNGTAGDTTDDYWSLVRTSTFPNVTEQVNIDGRTQPGTTCDPMNLKIELDVNNIGKGFDVRSLNVGIYGLVINHGNNNAIHLNQGSSNIIIQCNIIGLNKNGTTARSIGGIYQFNYESTFNGAVAVGSNTNITIGGTTADKRNIISGVQGNAIEAYPMDNSFIQGNYFGTDITGMVAIPNSAGSILLASSTDHTLIGGDTVVLGSTCTGSCNLFGSSSTSTWNFYLGQDGTNSNTIKGNFFGTNVLGTADLNGINGTGITLRGSDNNIIENNLIAGTNREGIVIGADDLAWTTTGNIIRNNYIGTNTTGTQTISIGWHGVAFKGTFSGGGTTNNTVQNNKIMGAQNGIQNDSGINVSGNKIIGNTITQNSSYGILLPLTTNTVTFNISQNNIFNNGLIGINLESNAQNGYKVNTNDNLDVDTGSNKLQNYPTLIGFVDEGTTQKVYGTFNSEASKNYRLEFFSNSVADSSGFGEGEVYLGYAIVTTDGSGNYNFATTPITITASLVDGQSTITATATECDNLACANPMNTSEFSNAVTTLSGFVVNSTEDTDDLTLGDGACYTGVLNSIGQAECTLHAAIQEANAYAGDDTVTFNIPNSDPNCLSFATNSGAGYNPDNAEVNCLAGNADPDLKWWRLTSTNTEIYNTNKVADFPVITDDIIIDATTQPGYIANSNPAPLALNGQPVVEMVCAGDSCLTNQGFVSYEVSGFSLYSNNEDGAVIGNNNPFGTDAQGNKITSIYTGTDISGLNTKGYSAFGVVQSCMGTANPPIIGGTNPSERNLLAAGTVSTLYSNYCKVNVYGNIMGLNKELVNVTQTSYTLLSDHDGGSNIGHVDAGNIIGGGTTDGISLWSSGGGTQIINNIIRDNTVGIRTYGNVTNIKIGGSKLTEGNVIINNGNGMNISNNVTVEGNYIGTDKSETAGLGNVSEGIYTYTSNFSLKGVIKIGGDTEDKANTIINNGADGISVGTNDTVTVSGLNRIFDNSGLGIDLTPDGVAANDNLDSDAGANDLQNYPILYSYSYENNSTDVYGTFNSTSNSIFKLSFFANTEKDMSEHGEGKLPVGSEIVTTDANGDYDFSITPIVLSSEVSTGSYISSIATLCADLACTYSTQAGTSEFSANAYYATNGLLNIIQETFPAGTAIDIELQDSDQNQDPFLVDLITITVQNNETDELENIILNETDYNTGVFTGQLNTEARGYKGVDNSGTMYVDHQDVVVATYNDPKGTNGQLTVVTDSAESIVSHPPIAIDDEASTLRAIPVTIDVLANDSDEDGNLQRDTITVKHQGTNPDAVVTITADFKIVYNPGPTFTGLDEFDYKICDTSELCDKASVLVNVGVTPPLINDDIASLFEDESIEIDVLANDKDALQLTNDQLDSSSLEVLSKPLYGDALVNSKTSTIDYYPNTQFSGEDTFTYKVCDLITSGCGTAFVNITILAIDDPIDAVDDNATFGNTQKLKVINVLANDIDPDGDIDTSTLKVITEPQFGTTFINTTDNFISYLYDGTNTTDTFVYEICDMQNNCDSASVNLTLTYENNQEPNATPFNINVDNLPARKVFTAPGGASIALVTALASSLSPAMIYDLPPLFLRLVYSILGLFGIKRKGNEWGYVYDSITKEPLNQAIVRVFNSSGKLVKTAVTNAYGVFNIELVKDKYKLMVTKYNYLFPTEIIKERSDAPIANIYKGGLITIDTEKLKRLSIPLDFTSSDPRKNLRYFVVHYSIQFIKTTGVLVFAYGFLLTFYSFYVDVSLRNVFPLSIYLVMIVILIQNIISSRRTGKAIYRNRPAPNIGFVLVNTLTGMVVDKRITDHKGEYRFVIGSGKFVVRLAPEFLNEYEIRNEGALQISNTSKRPKLFAKRVFLRKKVK